MILSVSRRTDIPNYYSDWFFNRLKKGFLFVRNPMNAHQVSSIDLSPSVIDCIVFWTKNPTNMINKLDELKGYDYYFQFTVTGYGQDVEQHLPDKKKVIIPTFKELSRKIGKERVIWRYDPILINRKYTQEYHVKAFADIAQDLSEYTEKVVISFVDLYAKTQRNTKDLNIRELSSDEMLSLGRELAQIAKAHNLKIESCAEGIDLLSVGIERGHCVDRELIERITGFKMKCEKDKNQRAECGCFDSIDIGSYNTCQNGCKYCYANFNQDRVKQNAEKYNVASPILCGKLNIEDKVTERAMQSFKVRQMRFDNYE